MTPKPSPANAPRYWRNEVGGELARAVEAYILRGPLSLRQVALIRAYFMQWVDAPGWVENPFADAGTEATLKGLRQSARAIATRADLDRWVADATAMGMDPL